VLVSALKRSATGEQDVAHRLHDKRKLSPQKNLLQAAEIVDYQKCKPGAAKKESRIL
jgi:hypothetical protein